MSLTGNATSGYILRGKVSKLDILRGYSAYEVAVMNGFKGTKEEWLASLKGEPFTYDDFTPEQLAELKGEPFTYEDFTPEQLNGLAGAVTTFNGRKGAVIPQSGDYTAAMVNAAPAGYGLGSENANNTSDANACLENGWYRGITTNGPPNTIPDGWLFVVSYSPNYKIQYYFNAITGAGRACVVAQRFMWSSAWGAWEFVNPPMELGVEYRTTERYNGKPVYVKAINFGTLPNSTQRGEQHGASNIQNVIAAGGSAVGEGIGTWQIPNETHSGNKVTIMANSGTVFVYANYDASANTATVWLKYTKTTDN